MVWAFKMKLIIAGSRLLDTEEALGIIKSFMYDAFHNKKPIDPTTITEVISGKCRGVDNAGENWAREEYWWDSGHTWKGKIMIKEFPPDWDMYGPAAGPMRNRKMAHYGDALLLIWDGKSRGSANMKIFMETQNKPIYEVILYET